MIISEAGVEAGIFFEVAFASARYPASNNGTLFAETGYLGSWRLQAGVEAGRLFEVAFQATTAHFLARQMALLPNPGGDPVDCRGGQHRIREILTCSLEFRIRDHEFRKLRDPTNLTPLSTSR